MIKILLKREAEIAWQGKLFILLLLGQALLIIFFYKLGLSSFPNLLQKSATTFIWVTNSIFLFLSYPKLFDEDEKSGALELLLTLPLSPYSLVFAKLMSLWFFIVLPLSVLSVLAGLIYGLPYKVLLFLPLVNAFSMLYVICFMMLGSIFFLKARRRFLLLPFLLLPFNIPNFLLSVLTLERVANGLVPWGSFGMLIGLILMMVPMTLLSSAFLLREAVRS